MLRGERQSSAPEPEGRFLRPRALSRLCPRVRVQRSRLVRAAGRARDRACRAGVRDLACRALAPAHLRLSDAVLAREAACAEGGVEEKLTCLRHPEVAER